MIFSIVRAGLFRCLISVLLVHSAVTWLIVTLLGLVQKLWFWRDVQFDAIRTALLNVAARVTEVASRINVALPSCYPYQDSWLLLAERADTRPP